MDTEAQAIQDDILKYVFPIVLLIPGAILLMFDIVGFAWGIVFVVLGDRPVGEANDVFYVLVLCCWVVLLYWSTVTDSSRRAIARACWAFCAGAFLLPVPGIAMVIFGPPDPPDQIIPKGVFLFVFILIGLPLGLLTRAMAKAMAPQGSPEQSGGIWYVFRPIGGGYLVLAMGLLFIGATVLRLYGFEGLL